MADETFSNGEPDCRLYEVFGYNEDDPNKVLKQYLGLLPLAERIKLWRKLRGAGAFKNAREAVRGLVPDWLVRLLKD